MGLHPLPSHLIVT